MNIFLARLAANCVQSSTYSEFIALPLLHFMDCFTQCVPGVQSAPQATRDVTAHWERGCIEKPRFSILKIHPITVAN